MKKLLSLIVLSLFMMTGLAWAQGSLTFDESGVSLPLSYGGGNFTVNGITWSYGHSRDEDGFEIEDKGLLLHRASDSYLEATIAGGIGGFSFQYRKAYTGGENNRELELIVGGTQVAKTGLFGGKGRDDTIHTLSHDVDVTGSTTIKIKIVGTSSSNAQVVIDNISWTAYDLNRPVLTADTSNLSKFRSVLGAGPSVSQQITISGSNLTDQVTVSAPESYEVSLNNSIFGNSVFLTQNTDGALVNKTVYIRLKGGLSVDEYKGNITVSSDGATSITIPLTGYVIKPAPTVHVTDFHATAAVPPCSTIKVTWTNPEGGNVPDSYLVLASRDGYNDIDTPVDGVKRNNTTHSKIVDGINEEVVFNQLNPLTTYYFKIYPYNNTDSDILYYTGGEVPQAEAKTTSEPVTFIFWDFNEEIFDEDTSNWVQSINSVVDESNGIFTAKGVLTHEFVPAVSFNGDTANGLTGTEAGKSFVPQGGTKDTQTDKFYNNGKSFELAISTTGYANIGLSYAIQRTGSGFTSNLIEYSVNGGASYIEHSSLTDIPTRFATRGFDFSDIPEANDNPDFKIKITLDGASAYDGNNRFDNIRITGSEICTYDTGIPVPLTGGPTVTMTNGRANDSGAEMPPIPNASDNQYVLKLALLDEGPWTIELESGLNFCAYYWGTEWQTVDKSGNSFLITVSKQRSGNDLFIVLSDKNPTLPVELSSFMVALNSNGNPVVTWETQTETGVNGFYIYRGVNKNLGEAILISSLVPATNSSLEHSYSFVDTELTEEGTYYYWLNVSDLNGQQSYHGPAELNFTFSEEEDTPEVVYTTALRSIYPNPFNPNANIGFELAESSEVAISVYNARGQLVRSFAPFTHGAGYGSIVWDGKDEGGSSVSSGIYLFRMTVGAKSFSAKALMLK